MPALSSFGGLSAIGRGQRASAPFSATGGTITTDGAYTVHTFMSSGTFTVLSGEKYCEYLVVGGGGPGGCTAGDTYCSGGLTGSGIGGVGGSINTAGGNGANYIPATQNAGGGGGGGGCARWGSALISSSKDVTVGLGGVVPNDPGDASSFNDITSGGGVTGGDSTGITGTGGVGGAAGTGTGGTTTPQSITALANYGKGGKGNSSAAAEDGWQGYVIVRYLTLG